MGKSPYERQEMAPRTLAASNPALAAQWHPTKNGELTPRDVAPGAGRKAWWQCEKGHAWEAVINSRNRGRGCPYCSGDRAWPGHNDLATTHPELVELWAHDLNEAISPEEVSAGSSKRAWWRCKEGHEWESQVQNRAILGRGCPYCAGQKVLAGYNDLGHHTVAKLWDHAANGGQDPTQVNEGSSKKAHWRCSLGHKWKSEVRVMVQGTGECPVCSGRTILPGFNSLAVVEPAIAREWSPTKNPGLDPDTIAPRSSRKVWWVCELGHEWKATPADRSLGNTCPECAEAARLGSSRSLVNTAPHLLEEWDWDKNGDLDPNKLTAGAHWKVHWKCSQGHTWKAAVHARAKGSGCPGCQKEAWAQARREKEAAREADRRSRTTAAGKLVYRAKPGKSLQQVSPGLAAQWHPTKNALLLPSVIGYQSNAEVWWLCDAGHEWEAAPRARQQGSGCPTCQEALRGQYNLATQAPELVEDWHPDRNGDLTPEELSPRSSKKVWWQCPEGHSYQKSPAGRSKTPGCPYCNKSQVLAGFNDLATTHPDLAAEWDYDRNPDTPQDVLAGSHKKRFWLCGSGHSWEAPLKARAHTGTGCPFCANVTLLVGFNDAATTHPHLVADWDVEANGALRPQDLMAFSSTRVAWKCAKCGWQWETKIAHRASGSGCPGCSPLLHTSGSETRLRDWLSQSGVLVDVVQDKNARLEIPWRTRTWMQVDVLGELAGTGRQVVVEYDGIQWHNNDDSFLRDRDKTVALLGAGILVVRVRENDLGFIDLEDPGLLQLNCEWSYDDGPTVEAASVIEAWLWSQLPADHPLWAGGAAA